MAEPMAPNSVFERLLKDRIIWLGSEVRDENANEICAKILLLAAEDPEADIYLYINSPGGSITAGMAIYDTMSFVPNDIVTVGIGMAASMGQFLLTAGTKGKRYITPNARVLLHQPHGGFGGTASDIQTQAQLITSMKNRLAETMSTLPEQLRRSITWDRGKEMSAHAQFKVETGIPVFFADPHSPWQRATNENGNGPLRQYFPKGTDLSRWSADEIGAVAHALNTRPRKGLQWKTPAEAFNEQLLSVQQAGVGLTPFDGHPDWPASPGRRGCPYGCNEKEVQPAVPA